MFSAGAVLACAWGRPSEGAQSVSREPAVPFPPMSVHKDKGCTCCDKWVQHLRKAGFTVTVVEEINMQPTKERTGVPPNMRSCHTGEVGEYFVEGHVPA